MSASDNNSTPFLLRPGAGLLGSAADLLRTLPDVVVRKAPANDSPGHAVAGKTGAGLAVFAGGLALGLAGALLLPRSRRTEWEQHADRLMKIAGEVGLALANEAVRIAQEREADAAAVIEAVAKPVRKSDGLGTLVRLLGRGQRD